MSNVFQLAIKDEDHRRSLARSLRDAGGVLVPSSVLVNLFDTVVVWFNGRAGEKTLEGTVVNVPPGATGFYAHFQAGPELDALRDWLGDPGDEPGDETPAQEVEPEVATSEGANDEQEETAARPTPAWELIDPSSSEPIHSQVRKLTLAEKLKVARTATRPVRELLIRDPEKRIHSEVMRNPKVTDEEIMVYTAMPNLSPRVLDWVSNQQKYMRRRAVMLNIVQNPMTPPDTAKKLLSRLNDNELLRITRSSKVREVVSRAAKKILMRKGVL
jgi:hypothetical protein